MERVDRILSNAAYRNCVKEIEEREKERIYCKHNMEHFLDVARIAQLLNLEEHRLLSKELVYATALLHDCGRHIQYDEGIPHELASAELADPILKQCGFDEQEREFVLQAVLLHRNRAESAQFPLADLIYRADKKSRFCMCCKASDTCHKSNRDRNQILTH